MKQWTISNEDAVRAALSNIVAELEYFDLYVSERDLALFESRVSDYIWDAVNNAIERERNGQK